MRVAGGGSGGGGSSYPPTGNLQVVNGGPNNASPLVFDPGSSVWGEYGACSDNTGKTLILKTITGAPNFLAELYDHSTGFSTELTLSGFGTFVSNPNFHLVGYDIENDDYWICFSINGGSGSITVDTLYPMSISGTTLTLGAGVTPPAIGGYAVNPNGNCVNNGKIVQTYSETTTFEIDESRVYDISGASWAAAAGTNKSPYAANTNAVLDSNVPDEVAFATGAQNNKGYVSCNHASNLPLFVEFDFINETFIDRTIAVPIRQNGIQQDMWSMGLDPLGNYGVGFFRSSVNNENVIFVYDTANDQAILFYGLEGNFSKFVFPGDESNGNLGWMLGEIGNDVKGFKIPYINEVSPTSGTVAGVEAIGIGPNSDYGASDCALLVNLDANGWATYPRAESLWSQGGFQRFLQPYADSLELIFIPPMQSGTFDLFNAPSIYYTN